MLVSKPAKKRKRIIKAVHALRQVKPDPESEVKLSKKLHTKYTREKLLKLYKHFVSGYTDFDALMRRAIWRAMARRFGHGVYIGSNAGFKHIETFEIGNNVFIGEQSYIQGRFDGRCVIGNHTWIGLQSYLDARDLIIGDYVGWGPGAKVLGSVHTGLPIDTPIIKTELEIKPVRIEADVDIGVNAVVLPGVTIGQGSIVGAGAVVSKNVVPFSVVAGVPARFLRWRKGYKPSKKYGKK